MAQLLFSFMSHYRSRELMHMFYHIRAFCFMTYYISLNFSGTLIEQGKIFKPLLATTYSEVHFSQLLQNTHYICRERLEKQFLQ